MNALRALDGFVRSLGRPGPRQLAAILVVAAIAIGYSAAVLLEHAGVNTPLPPAAIPAPVRPHQEAQPSASSSLIVSPATTGPAATLPTHPSAPGSSTTHTTRPSSPSAATPASPTSARATATTSSPGSAPTGPPTTATPTTDTTLEPPPTTPDPATAIPTTTAGGLTP